MIKAVSFGNANIQSVSQARFQQENPPENKEESLSTTSKALVGLGALASVAVGGLLVKKHIDTNAIKKLVEKIVEKPPEFNQAYEEELIEKWATELKLPEGAKGEIQIFPREKALEILSALEQSGMGARKKYKKCYEQSSENAILVRLELSDKKDAFKILDPQKISHKILEDTLAKGKIYCRKFE